MTIQPHNQKSAATWGAGGASYDKISETIADSIEHVLNRLNVQRGEKALDLATGTGWTARRLAQKGAVVAAVDIGEGVIAAARELARTANLNIEFAIGDAEKRLPVESRWPAPGGALFWLDVGRNLLHPRRRAKLLSRTRVSMRQFLLQRFVWNGSLRDEGHAGGDDSSTSTIGPVGGCSPRFRLLNRALAQCAGLVCACSSEEKIGAHKNAS
jgi:SAM-dependent methyltransferase